MDTPPRTLLEQLVRLSNRTLVEHAIAFEATGRQHDEPAALSPRQLGRWMAGNVRLAHPVSRRVAELHFGYPFDVLVGPPILGEIQPRDRVEHAPARFQLDPLEAAALMAAHESSQHAASVGGGVDPTSIDQVQATVLSLAHQYHQVSPVQMLMRTKFNRDLTYQLLDRTRRPAEMTDLYILAALNCGLLALASFDLGFYDAGEEHARSAKIYAELGGHTQIRAWAHGTQALVAFWRDQPRRALDVVEAGLALAPEGKQAARLRGIEARSRALLGDELGVTQAITAADQAMDGAPDDEIMDGIGGEFGWGPSLHNACAGTALLVLGDGAKAAARVRAAIDAFPNDPNANLVPERAQIDLAGAELLSGRLDQAEAALAPIWSIPVDFRRQTFTGRMEVVARLLVSPQWRHDRAAQTLRDQVEAFNADAHAQRALAAS